MRLFAPITLSLLSLPGLARALEQVPLHPPVSPASHPPTLYDDLEELSRIVDISYCVGTANTGISEPFSCLSRCAEFPSFELIKTWNSGLLMTDSCGYIALSHAPAAPRIIVAFRGTYSIANTILDLATTPQEYLPYPGSNSSLEHAPKCTNCSVHLGFYKSFTAARDLIIPILEPLLEAYPTYNLTLVGHSLGGAVATLAGLDALARGWHPSITTFGAPKLGNAALAAYIDARLRLSDPATGLLRRVTHRDDPVPLLPPTEWNYVPHAGEVYVNSSSLPVKPEDLVMCEGDADPVCSAGQDASAATAEAHAVQRSGGMAQFEAPEGVRAQGWVPTRFKIWQLLFAHRDYFYRLGLCLPEMRWPGSREGKEVV